MRQAREDPNLAEVKAVLRKLQRLDLPGEAQPLPDRAAPAPRRSAPSAAEPAPNLSIFDRKRAAFEGPAARAKPHNRSLIYAAVALAFIAAAGAVYAWVKAPHNSSALARNDDARPALSKQDESILITEARGFLSKGDVVSARARLKRGVPEERADLAFMLAQSFDPNYLRTLPSLNASPDRAEAERWYRKWHELAVNGGLEMDSERLRRIINAMP
ncbi:MAG: hypothetical protein WAN43_01815 [Rhodomicrobium sp.]|jgi:hypothetical protein